MAVIVFAATYNALDFRIYMWGGHAVLDDSRLYLALADGHWFTYSPFAAIVFVPVSALEYGFHWLTTLIANCFLVAGLVFLGFMAVRELRGTQHPPGQVRDLAPPGRAEVVVAELEHGQRGARRA